MEPPYGAVLRVEVSDNPNGIAAGAAALQVAREHGVRAPRLIGADPEGTDAGIKACREDLDAATLNERRDLFLSCALAALDAGAR